MYHQVLHAQTAFCPLTPTLRGLLETAITLGTTNNKVLAAQLFCSEETVKSNFRRISQLLDTHSRSEALLYALQQGWVTASAPPPTSTAGQVLLRPH